MNPNVGPGSIYAPTQSERARQDFVLALKLLANGSAQQRVREECESSVLPQRASELGRAPARREDVEVELCRTQAFRQWAVLTHRSQSMMWQAVEATAQRVAPTAAQALARLYASPQRHGSLTLDPQLAVPPPIGNTEIHRQPGGFVGGPEPMDALAGLRYLGATQIYAPGKGNAEAAHDARGLIVVEQIRRHCGEIAPRRILELGCGIGTSSQAIALAFPGAEYHAVDVAAGLLRLAHLLAEQRGVPISFYQRDAAATGFPAGHFDLVVSNILFHETNAARLPQILRECRRVLAPGGAMVHVDVATQVTRLPLADQVMNDWQVRWNGEPFWTAFAETDMRERIIAAGFPAEHVFAEHVRRDKAGWHYVFGATP